MALEGKVRIIRKGSDAAIYGVYKFIRLTVDSITTAPILGEKLTQLNSAAELTVLEASTATNSFEGMVLTGTWTTTAADTITSSGTIAPDPLVPTGTSTDLETLTTLTFASVTTAPVIDDTLTQAVSGAKLVVTHCNTTRNTISGWATGTWDLVNAAASDDAGFVTMAPASLTPTVIDTLTVVVSSDFEDECGHHDITGASATADWLTIAGDYTHLFYPGQTFRVEDSTANDAVWTVKKSVYTGTSTYIHVTGDITNATATGAVKVEDINIGIYGAGVNTAEYYVANIWESGGYAAIQVTNDGLTQAGASGGVHTIDYLTYEFAAHVVPEFEVAAMYVTDRRGTVHRIMTAIADVQRLTNFVTISLPTFDMDKPSSTGLILPDFIEAYVLNRDDQLEIFVERSGTDQDDNDYTRKLCYKGKIDDVPGFLYDTQVMLDGDDPGEISFKMWTQYNGVFGDFDDVESASWRAH